MELCNSGYRKLSFENKWSRRHKGVLEHLARPPNLLLGHYFSGKKMYKHRLPKLFDEVNGLDADEKIEKVEEQEQQTKDRLRLMD